MHACMYPFVKSHYKVVYKLHQVMANTGDWRACCGRHVNVQKRRFRNSKYVGFLIHQTGFVHFSQDKMQALFKDFSRRNLVSSRTSNCFYRALPKFFTVWNTWAHLRYSGNKSFLRMTALITIIKWTSMLCKHYHFKEPLIKYHSETQSTLYKRICSWRDILQIFIKNTIGPTRNLGPKCPKT